MLTPPLLKSWNVSQFEFIITLLLQESKPSKRALANTEGTLLTELNNFMFSEDVKRLPTPRLRAGR